MVVYDVFSMDIGIIDSDPHNRDKKSVIGMVTYLSNVVKVRTF